MMCPICKTEMKVSHIQKEVIDKKEVEKPVYVCLNKQCPQYSRDSKLK
mgnify:CR=1 FL=1